MADKKKTILDDDAYAVTWSPNKGFSMLLPKGLKEDEDLPAQALALMAIGLRITEDPSFVGEMETWMTSKAENEDDPKH